MAWFLAMQGPSAKAVLYQLQDSADVDKIAEELASATTLGRVVSVPAILQNNQRPVNLYVRPAAWGVWTFYELSEEEMRSMATAANPLIEALTQAAKQQQGKNAGG
jgi:hypothetical protein